MVCQWLRDFAQCGVSVAEAGILLSVVCQRLRDFAQCGVSEAEELGQNEDYWGRQVHISTYKAWGKLGGSGGMFLSGTVFAQR